MHNASRRPARQSRRPAPQAGLLNSPVILIAGAIVVFAVIAFVVLPQCSPSAQSSSAASANTAASQTSSSASSQTASASTNGATPNTAALNQILGEEEAAKLLKQADTNEDAYWIASHPEAFAFDGETVQWKTLKLAADEPTSLKYVRDFADKYPQDTANMDSSIGMDDSYLKGTKFDTGVPHLYQWDRRWGLTTYSSTAFGLTGCGPTCMAMIYQGLTGKTDLSPYDMATRAQQGGYMDQYQGTSTSFYFDQAEKLGLTCADLGISADSIRASLRSGNLIIANLGQGVFTRFGHFFVLTGVDENGDIIINDPYSEVRSNQTWDAGLIASESKALFEFSR